MIELTIYSRPGCHLCDEMKTVVQRVVEAVTAPNRGPQRGSRVGVEITVEEIDISNDRDLEARYGVEVPVLLVDGRKFEQRGLSVIAHVSDVSLVITADARQRYLEVLEDLGVNVQSV